MAISKANDNIFFFLKRTYTIKGHSNKFTFILNFFSSDVNNVNIEYVLNDSTVFEKRSKVCIDGSIDCHQSIVFFQYYSE